MHAAARRDINGRDDSTPRWPPLESDPPLDLRVGDRGRRPFLVAREIGRARAGGVRRRRRGVAGVSDRVGFQGSMTIRPSTFGATSFFAATYFSIAATMRSPASGV